MSQLFRKDTMPSFTAGSPRDMDDVTCDMEEDLCYMEKRSGDMEELDCDKHRQFCDKSESICDKEEQLCFMEGFPGAAAGQLRYMEALPRKREGERCGFVQRGCRKVA